MKKIQFLKVGDYMKTITRTKYLDRIIELNGTPDIKIITGIRRSGKSKLMQAYIEYLKSNFENINIIFIDFMDLAYEEIMEYHALHAYVEEHYQEGKTNYLFVDEVQMCPNFELAINSLYSKGIYDIYVTGSNAFLLSADLATLFTGRYIEIHVFPFSFQEYCQYYDDVSDKDKLFDDYTIKGGLAGSYAYRTEKDRTNYIKEVYETIVTRDLVQKYALPDTLVLQRLSEFLMDNISNLTSPNKVSQLLTANETPTNHSICAMLLYFMILRDTTSEVRNTLKALKSSIYVTAVFDMQYLEAEIWIMAEYMKTSFASSFFAVDTMSMSASSIKRKSTLLLSEAARSFIFKSATTFPVRKHLRENALLSFRFEMLIRK